MYRIGLIIIFIACLTINAQGLLFGNDTIANYLVETAEKTIYLPKKDWEEMGNEYIYALNFQLLKKDSIAGFPQVITFFLIPMTMDRRKGKEIAEKIYLEIFCVHSGKVTIQIRCDKGKYWVLSRETFFLPDTAALTFEEKVIISFMPGDLKDFKELYKYKPFLNEAEFKWLHDLYIDHIDRTIFLINNKF